MSRDKEKPFRDVMREISKLREAFIHQVGEYWRKGGKGQAWNAPKVPLLTPMVPPLVRPSEFLALVPVDYCLQELSTLLDDGCREHLTHHNVRILKTVFDDAADWLIRVHKKTPTLDNIALVIFHERQFYERVEKAVLEVYLKCCQCQ